MGVEHTRGTGGIEPLPLQHRVGDLRHVPADLEHLEVAEALPTSDDERLHDVLVREALALHRAVEVARHEEGEALIGRGHPQQPPGHAVAVKDLAVARPAGLGEAGRARRRNVEQARERARQGDDEQRTQLLCVDQLGATLQQSEPVHASSVRSEDERFM